MSALSDRGVPMKCCCGCCWDVADEVASLMRCSAARAALALSECGGSGVAVAGVGPCSWSRAAAVCMGGGSLMLAGVSLWV